MAAIGTIMGVVGAVASLGGTILGAVAQKKAGAAQQRVANYEAEQLDLRAHEEIAAGQRESFEIGREKDLLLSRQQVLAAAGGGMATDPTILDLAGDVEAAGAYRQRLTAYGAVERAKGLRAQAAGARASGVAAVRGANMAAAGTILSGVSGAFSSFYDAFGSGRPVTGQSYLRYG